MIRAAMRHLHRPATRLPLRLPLAWLLWLALLLPLGQSASVWHLSSHAAAEAAAGVDGPDPASPHAGHCAWCPVASAAALGGLDGAPAPLATLPGRAPQVAAALHRAVLAPVPPHYRSRAPPAFFR